MNINDHQTIYVVTPEITSSSRLLFRDNIVPMIKGKHVLVLAVSVAAGGTVKAVMEAVNFVFNSNDLPGYFTCPLERMPALQKFKKLDALTNSH